MMNALNVLPREIDVICMGRVAIDLYSEQVGMGLENTQTFRKYLGGSAGNIAVGCARLGLRSAMLSCVGKDALGRFLKTELLRESVDIHSVRESPDHLTGLAILGIDPPERFPLIFYRKDCADMQLNFVDIDELKLANAKTLLLTGTGLSTAKMCAVSHHAVTVAKKVKTKTILDLDYRPVLWNLTAKGDGETRFIPSLEVTKTYQDMIERVDLIVGTEEEFAIASGEKNIKSALRVLRQLSQSPFVVKKGKAGCDVYFADVKEPLSHSGFPVTVLNVLGAGDAFMSGLLFGLLRHQSWQTSIAYACASGAIVVTRHGCAPSMPSSKEVLALIREEGDSCQIC